jgi:hypothetical protein
MKLTHWIRMHEAGSRGARPLGILLAGQALLAAAALGMDLLGLCGSCGGGDPVHAAIAGIGLGGYLLLLALLRGKAWTPVFFGVFAATGVHLALAGLMIARGAFCPLCALSAVLALAAPATLLIQDREGAVWIARATVPAFLVAGLVTWTMVGARDARAVALRAEAQEAAHLLSTITTSEGDQPRPSDVLHVFESAHCPYCREFRGSYAPRLAKDFPALEIVYHSAQGVPWIGRTPTLMLGSEIAFEGLPVDYKDLFQVVSRASSAGTVTRTIR